MSTGKIRRPASDIENDDDNSDDQIMTNELINLSDKDFRKAIWKMLKELKETMDRVEQNTNKNQEIMTTKITKLQTEITCQLTGLKNSVNELNDKMDNLNTRVAEAENRIGAVEDEINNNSILQERLEKKLKIKC